MGGIVAITNPNAKKNRKVPDRKQRLERALGDAGVVFETPMPSDLTPLMERVLEIDPEIIAVCGGDGTMHLTLTALIHAYGGTFPPKLVVLRAGTVNTVARALGVRLPPERMLARVVESYRNGEPLAVVERKTIELNGMYGFLFGVGMPGEFNDLYNRSKVRGPIGVASAVLSTIVAMPIPWSRTHKKLFGKVRGRFIADDVELFIKKAYGVVGGTLEYMGPGFKLLYRANESDEHFQVMISRISAFTALRNARRPFVGKPLKTPPHVHYDLLVKKLEIVPDEPVAITIDGEVYRAAHVLVKLGPKVKVVVG